jgi:hypothetical protein
VLTAAARERQEAKVERVTVERTVEEERRLFEAEVLARANQAIAEVDHPHRRTGFHYEWARVAQCMQWVRFRVCFLAVAAVCRACCEYVAVSWARLCSVLFMCACVACVGVCVAFNLCAARCLQ